MDLAETSTNVEAGEMLYSDHYRELMFRIIAEIDVTTLNNLKVSLSGEEHSKKLTHTEKVMLDGLITNRIKEIQDKLR
jgi:hypothetical protein